MVLFKNKSNFVFEEKHTLSRSKYIYISPFLKIFLGDFDFYFLLRYIKNNFKFNICQYYFLKCRIMPKYT